MLLYDGPIRLEDRVVWFKNGVIHRDDGPAVEFADGQQLWALEGQEVAKAEVERRLEDYRRQARELSDEMLREQNIRLVSTGQPVKLMKPLRFKQSGS